MTNVFIPKKGRILILKGHALNYKKDTTPPPPPQIEQKKTIMPPPLPFIPPSFFGVPVVSFIIPFV